MSYDQSLLVAFEAMLREKKEQLESRKTVSMQIRHLLLSVFHGQITHIDIVASSLFMTTRTLRRKLSEEDTTYRAISNELRRDLAHGLIKAGRNNKTQISGMLGYSDTSSFNKAFRSWEKR